MMQSQKKYTLIVTQLSEGDNMKRQKTMTPEDASKYCDICPQFFREMLKANKVDFGVAVNPTGRRWRYAIVPQKFFDWLGIPVPVEWR